MEKVRERSKSDAIGSHEGLVSRPELFSSLPLFMSDGANTWIENRRFPASSNLRSSLEAPVVAFSEEAESRL